MRASRTKGLPVMLKADRREEHTTAEMSRKGKRRWLVSAVLSFPLDRNRKQKSAESSGLCSRSL